MLEVDHDLIEPGRWVARYDRWEVSRLCPIQAVADVLEAELQSLQERDP